METLRDLNKFIVLDEKLISKKVFFSESHEGEPGFYSICLIPLAIGKQFKIENAYLSKTRDESYFSKVEDIKLFDRSNQVDLTKYSAEGTEQNIDLKTEVTAYKAFRHTNADDDNVESINFDFDVENPPFDFDFDSSFTKGSAALVTYKSETTGKIDSPNSINFTGANSFIINQIVKAIISKNPANTYLEVNLFSVGKEFLNNLLEVNNPFRVVIENQVISINTKSDLENIEIPDNLRDHYPRFLIELNPETSHEIFHKLDIIASFSTSDSTQTQNVINYESQKPFIAIVASAKPSRYSYNLDEEFEQIYKVVENDGNQTLEDIITEFNTKFDEAKTELSEILDGVKDKLLSDLPLQNTMKTVNIEGIFQFNLKEVSYD